MAIAENYDKNATKEFFVDTVADVANLPTNLWAGSHALVIETGDLYVLNTEGTWVAL